MSGDPRASGFLNRLEAVGKSISWLSREINVTRESLRQYLYGLARPRDESIWAKIDSAILLQEATVIAQSGKKPIEKQTDVYYNPNHDSASGFSVNDLSAAFDTLKATVRSVPIGTAWSAKNIGTLTVEVSALLGAASEKISLVGDLENIKSGSIVVFQATSDPIPGLYLLFSSRTDQDLRMLGWINGARPTQIQTGVNTYDLADWEPIGYAIAVAWGPGPRKNNVKIGLDGLGPMSQIQ
ncbi:MAG: hypothetical protein JST51_01590 [Armatimonadetes bacterium]|nr:hypothetical protein [Armatimonadota bacterium]